MLNPIVQQTTMGDVTIPAPESFYLNIAPARKSSYAVRDLHQWIKLSTSQSAKGSLPITLGVKGDRIIRKIAHLIPTQKQGYHLSVTPQGITIAGADERGLFYGLQTLRQLLADGRLALGSITDYPDVPYRGVVEGFYGTPWSYEDRLRQLEFYGRNKLNVYIYGPKDDPYHSVPNWRLPYPEREAEHIKALVNYAHEHGVIFYWAIHPGQDIKWDEKDRDTLLNKFESMYQLGVRGFAVFFDDISGEGTKADKQASLLNFIDDNFIRTKGDVSPLIMCPTEYNKSWSRIEQGYLPTLGDKLNPGIEVMWTGNTVVATIDKPDMEWINGYIKRKGYVWFNFPVSDFVRNHLLLGETYGNSHDIADEISGFLSNPMEHAESSKIALYSVADYTWNMKAYNSETSWQRAIKAIFPEAPDALLTFASHSSALGKNGHRFDRKESVVLEPILQRIKENKATVEDRQKLLDECHQIRFATNRILASESNPSMLKEMRPWLLMAKLVGKYGAIVVEMSFSPDRFDHLYEQAQSIQKLMYLLDTTENQNPYQPGIRYGSQHLLPAINALLARNIEQYNKATGSTHSIEVSYTPFSLTSSIPQLAHQPVQTRGKQISISPSNEVINWSHGDNITLLARRAEKITSLSIDLDSHELKEDDMQLEVLIDSKWHPIGLQRKEGNTTLLPASPIEGIDIQGIRLSYIGSTGKDLRLKHFRFTIK